MWIRRLSRTQASAFDPVFCTGVSSNCANGGSAPRSEVLYSVCAPPRALTGARGGGYRMGWGYRSAFGWSTGCRVSAWWYALSDACTARAIYRRIAGGGSGLVRWLATRSVERSSSQGAACGGLGCGSCTWELVPLLLQPFATYFATAKPADASAAHLTSMGPCTYNLQASRVRCAYDGRTSRGCMHAPLSGERSEGNEGQPGKGGGGL